MRGRGRGYLQRDSFLAAWEDMHQIWEHTFKNVLKIDPTEEGSKIMLTNPPLNPTASRMRMMEAMFERHGFSALSLQVQAGLTLYAQGTVPQKCRQIFPISLNPKPYPKP
jgi:actin-related protein 2